MIWRKRFGCGATSKGVHGGFMILMRVVSFGMHRSRVMIIEGV
jgi:hypothetical protein